MTDDNIAGVKLPYCQNENMVSKIYIISYNQNPIRDKLSFFGHFLVIFHHIMES